MGDSRVSNLSLEMKIKVAGGVQFDFCLFIDMIISFSRTGIS